MVNLYIFKSQSSFFCTSMIYFAGSSCFLDNSDYPGNDLNNCGNKTDSANECHKLCQTTDDWVQFTWIGLNSKLAGRAKECCLKNNVTDSPTAFPGLVSGPKFCSKCYLSKDTYWYSYSIIPAMIINSHTAINFFCFRLLWKRHKITWQ